MRTWAFVSQKGGAGKTTLCVHLSTYAVQQGEVVLIVDIDPQESAGQWHKRRGAETETPAVLPAIADAIPRIMNAAREHGITLLMIDTAPALDAGALAAIHAADLVITPTMPNFFDLDALRTTVDLINNSRKMSRAVCVVNGVQSQSEFMEASGHVRMLGINVCPAYIQRRKSYQTSLVSGLAVTEFKPRDSKACREMQQLYDNIRSIQHGAT